MAQTKHEIRAILARAGSEPRHRFGQNFMIDQNLVRLVADAGEITPADVVIEVGPGTGTLTEELLSRGVRVLAVEIDRDLAKLLRERFSTNARFTDAVRQAVTAARFTPAWRGGKRVRMLMQMPFTFEPPTNPGVDYEAL
jgi:16S rRNA A1518/A1519 N6-dimethyltransferase RsmA/KsgA/DIM1 with predicted DNA glycosylase/AP lyase activity